MKGESPGNPCPVRDHASFQRLRVRRAVTRKGYWKLADTARMGFFFLELLQEFSDFGLQGFGKVRMIAAVEVTKLSPAVNNNQHRD